jgi:pimeloyl-ACP methyl ester carboxylesterase
MYQQMVIGPNAYWLNFFLKRDINVICWNYRGYGESTIGMFDFLTPAKAKLDCERVLASSMKVLRLEGKIGVFGRSIGGISACHLASKYNDLVELMVIDRSMNEVFEIMSHKLKMSTLTSLLYYFFLGWNCNNS